MNNNKIRVISREFIKAVMRNSSSKVIRLDLSDNQISQIENLEEMKRTLQELNLSKNQLASTAGLNELAALTVLDLSSNLITEITQSSLRNLQQLEKLDLRFNRLGESGKVDFSVLACNKALRELNVAGNLHVTSDAMYRENIKRAIPQIEIIDGLNVQRIRGFVSSSSSNEDRQIDVDVQRIVDKEMELKGQRNSVHGVMMDQQDWWKNRCREYVVREKIMIHRLNIMQKDQQIMLAGIEAKHKEEIKKVSDASHEIEQHYEQQIDELQGTISRLESHISEQQRKYEQQQKGLSCIKDQHNREIQEIARSWQEQVRVLSDGLEGQVDQAVKSQERRLFKIEGKLMELKNKLLQKRKEERNRINGFKEQIAMVIRTHAGEDIKGINKQENISLDGDDQKEEDINDRMFFDGVVKRIRDGVIMANSVKEKNMQGSDIANEINAYKNEVIELQGLRMQLLERVKDAERAKNTAERMLKEKQEELMNLKVAEDEKIKDLISELDAEKSKNAQVQNKLNSAMESYLKNEMKLKKAVLDAQEQMTQKVKQLEQVNVILEQSNTELMVVSNQLRIETEAKNSFANQVKELLKMLNDKENKIRGIKLQLQQQQQQKIHGGNASSSGGGRLNQTMQPEYQYYHDRQDREGNIQAGQISYQQQQFNTTPNKGNYSSNNNNTNALQQQQQPLRGGMYQGVNNSTAGIQQQQQQFKGMNRMNVTADLINNQRPTRLYDDYSGQQQQQQNMQKASDQQFYTRQTLQQQQLNTSYSNNSYKQYPPVAMMMMGTAKQEGNFNSLETNNFGSSKPNNMNILNDLSAINDNNNLMNNNMITTEQQPLRQEILEDEFRKFDAIEDFAKDILNDSN